MAAGARQQTSEPSPGGRASPSPDVREFLQSGREIAGDLRLERAIGARGTVWLARDAAGRPWAVKAAAPALIEHEARLLSRLTHAHIVRMHRLVPQEPGPILVLEYLAGGDLVSLAGAKPEHWLPAAAAVVGALEYLHDQGLVHRDLKARNVLLDERDRARLIDFGSSSRIGASWTAGGTTAAAVAPDRRGEPATPADDVYALAALIHELLYGVPPGMRYRCQPDASAKPLIAVVEDCLTSRAAAGRVGLPGLRTVIESLAER